MMERVGEKSLQFQILKSVENLVRSFLGVKAGHSTWRKVPAK